MSANLFEAGDLPVFWRLGASAQQHAQALGQLLALPVGATVVHIGLGGDELAKLLPELQWSDGQDLPPGTADAVVMSYALGAEPVDQLRRARQLLVAGGTLVLQDLFARDRGSQMVARQVLGLDLHDLQAVELWAELEGFALAIVLDELHRAPGARLDAAMPVLEQLQHTTFLFRKARESGVLDEGAALQFSGGKDSLACLLLCLPYVRAGLPVYWGSTGDGLPETLEVVRWASEIVPDFRVVQADVKAWRERFGMPSDVLPADCTPMGMANGMGQLAMSGRFDCCWFNRMAPMHARMLADRIQTVVRGTKLVDAPKAPRRDDVPYGVVLPIDGWSHGQVLDYLARWAEFKNPIYDVATVESAPECLGCTAWWGDGKAQYFKARQPELLGQYVVSLQSMREQLQLGLAKLDAELKECER